MTTQLHRTTFLAFPSLSILHKPDHSPNFLLSSTYKLINDLKKNEV